MFSVAYVDSLLKFKGKCEWRIPVPYVKNEGEGDKIAPTPKSFDSGGFEEHRR